MRYLIILLLLLTIGCSTTKYVEIPVETVKTEYKTIEKVDTVIAHDSIIIKDSGDTVFIEKYKYLYRIRESRDTVMVIDSIPVIQKVEITKEVNKLKTWQIILMILGGVSIIFSGYKLIK